MKSHRIKHNLSAHPSIPTNFNITKVATSNQVIRSRCHFYGWLSCRYLWITTAKWQKNTYNNYNSNRMENKKKSKSIFIIVLRFHSLRWKCAATAEKIINIGNLKCRKWCRTTQNNTKIYWMQFSIAFLEPTAQSTAAVARHRKRRRRETEKTEHKSWTENGFTDALNSWIDETNRVHLIGTQIDVQLCIDIKIFSLC